MLKLITSWLSMCLVFFIFDCAILIALYYFFPEYFHDLIALKAKLVLVCYMLPSMQIQDPLNQLMRPGAYVHGITNQPIASNIAQALQDKYNATATGTLSGSMFSPLPPLLLLEEEEQFVLSHLLQNDPVSYNKVMAGIDINVQKVKWYNLSNSIALRAGLRNHP